MTNKPDFTAAALLPSKTLETLHMEAFRETYKVIRQFTLDSKQSNQIHIALCSPPGHGKTTALEYHIKREILQTEEKKNPYLLVFNNNDNMTTFYNNVLSLLKHHSYTGRHIIKVTSDNIDQSLGLLTKYQVVCITQQRLRDLALGYGKLSIFNTYNQEALNWGEKGDKKHTTNPISRTVIIDEMPIFFNKAVFDIGKENNSVDWFDTLANNTSDKDLSLEAKKNGRIYISQLINNELNIVRNSTLKLIRTLEGNASEQELINILDKLDVTGIDSETVSRFKWFMKLLKEDGTGAINKTYHKTNILCSELIDYKILGNILILDGTSNITKEIYQTAGFELKLVKNYHNYNSRLFINWKNLNTSKTKRSDKKSNIKEIISEDVVQHRQNGDNILAIPASGDKNYYIKSGAITPEQQSEFFTDRQFEDDSLSINIHNVTGKNNLNTYSHLALLNLPIKHPDEYRLQAIGLYGTDIDLRLIKNLNDIERKDKLGKWFVEESIQSIFVNDQLADLSQIIHRSDIRNINSEQKVNISLYHNKKNVHQELKELFKLPDKNMKVDNLLRDTKFKEKCEEWSYAIKDNLNKKDTNKPVTAIIGGNKFKNWLKDNWSDNEKIITETFKTLGVKIEVSGKKNYKYFSLIQR